MIFKLEDDLREWVKNETENTVWWIEPNRGSTIGLPDCCLPRGDGRSVWLELKIGEFKKDRLIYKVRPEQRRQIKIMLAAGQKVALLVGIKGESSVMALKPTTEVLDGDVVAIRAMNLGVLKVCAEGVVEKGPLGLVEVAAIMAEGGWGVGGTT